MRTYPRLGDLPAGWFWLAIVLLWVTAPWAGAQPIGPHPAELLSVSDEWQFALRVDGQRRSVAAKDLVYWGAFRESPGRSNVLLADGGVLAGETTKVDEDGIRLVTELWGGITLPRHQVASIVFSYPPDLASRDALLRQLQSDHGEEDRLFLENGDRLAGNALELDLSASRLRFQPGLARTPLEIDLSRVTALRLGHQTGITVDAEPYVEVGWRDGSRLRVSRFSDAQGEIESLTVGGLRLLCRGEPLWAAVTWIQPMGFGSVRYLSELPVDSYRQVPFLDGQRPWGRDQNVLGGELRVAGVRYSKGLGMAPASRLSYALPPGSRQFAAELAVDDRAGNRGSVVLRVFSGYADDVRGVRWKMLYESPVIRGGARPVPISLELEGATKLALLVDFADRGDELDYANWLHARLVIE